MSKRKLLLADDSVTIQKVVNLTFADEGIDVITVGDGNSAMAKISEVAPDVILADVHMPGLSGYQVCEMVRSNEATRQLPVVLLVGSFEPFDETEAARVGANAYLTKPFQSIRQLVTQVSDLIQASSPEPEPETLPPLIEEVSETDVTVPANADAVGGAAAVPKARDTSDIDNLYTQSFGGPVGGDASASAQPAYVDAGMDDEMIETTHADASDQEEELEQLVYDDYEASGQHAYAEPAVSEQPAQYESAYTEPTPNEEPAYAESEVSEQPARYESAYTEPSSHEEPDFAESSTSEPAPSDGGTSNDFAFVNASPQPEQPIAEFGYSQEQPVLHSDYGEHTAVEEPRSSSPFDAPAEAETDPNIGSILEHNAYVDQFAATQGVDEATRSAYDEEDPLELPPLEDGKTIELTTSEGRKEVVSLSPELMDMLVERVKKELTEKS